MGKLAEAYSIARKLSVLIIDDEESIRKSLSIILNENGYDADSAKNGEEAIKKTAERYYNILLIDIVLPDINGVELLTRIRDAKPKMRKIIMTGNPSLQNAVDALNRGADAYVMKPLEIEKILAIINEQLEKQRQEEKTAMELFQHGRLRARIELISREGSG